ncbi:MAG: amidohydrolase family protein, partial [Bacteroidia bacterium]|nr:amidohydrolase family protein [Bacteroidia bacterium]
MLIPNEDGFAFAKKQGVYSTQKLTVRCFKLYADGALGSRGALLKEAYCDHKQSKGLQLHSADYFDSMCIRIGSLGYQVAAHAIGDSANKLILNAYRFNHYIDPRFPTFAAQIPTRWRIEHAQVVDTADIGLFKRNIIPSVQPTHATSDMYWAGDRLCKDRLKIAYPYKKLLDISGTIALGTDFPVEDISPVKTFYAAVFRKDAKGYPKGGFQMENALTRLQALKGMTTWAAYSNFEETKKGMIKAGMDADFVILDTDIMKVQENKILKAKVIATCIFGKEVYRLKTVTSGK